MISSRQHRKALEQRYQIHTPKFFLDTVPRVYRFNRLCQTQDQIARRNINGHQSESLPTLALDCVAQSGGTRQPFRYYQSETRSLMPTRQAIVQIENRAAQHLSSCHDR